MAYNQKSIYFTKEKRRKEGVEKKEEKGVEKKEEKTIN